MSPASSSKSKDKIAVKEPQKASSKPSGNAHAGGGIPTSGYNPLLGTFHTLETAPVPSAQPLHVNGRFRNIGDTDDHSGSLFGTGVEYDSISNNDSWSGESEDHKEKMGHPPLYAIPGSDSDKREKIRQKNEKKHQRQKEKRAQELHERCSGYLMSRKLEALSQQLVAMGFSSERATMALILNEGRVEESVAWLFEGGEEGDKHEEHNLNGGGNLKIDISEELARIAEMEIRFNCSKQEVERAIVACEGDLEKALETLRVQKQDLPSASPKPEETGDRLVAVSQNSLRAQTKPTSSTTIQQKRDEKDFNYAKIAVTVGSSSVESGSKSTMQPLKKIQPKLEWAKQQHIAVPSEKMWPIAGPLQTSLPQAKAETRHMTVGSELKNLQLGSVREPVIMMQRPQSINAKQMSNLETAKANGLKIPSPNNQLYNNQFHYQQQQQSISRVNGLWSRTAGTSPTLAAASSLGLFSGWGSNGSSGSLSPVDWNAGGSMLLQSDYTNIDWSLDRGPPSSFSRPSGINSSFSQSDPRRMYDSYITTSGGLSVKTDILSNGNGVSSGGLQDDGVATATATAAAAETSAGEWTSPFEERDLFTLHRQLVSSPSL